MVVGGFIWYHSSLNAINKNSENVTVIIENGAGINGIAQKLKQENLIKNELAFKIYCKLSNRTQLLAGKYELNRNMSVQQIVGITCMNIGIT